MRGFVERKTLVAAVTQRGRGPSFTRSYSAGIGRGRGEGFGSYGDAEDSVFSASCGHGTPLNSAEAGRGRGRGHSNSSSTNIGRGFDNQDRTGAGGPHSGPLLPNISHDGDSPLQRLGASSFPDHKSPTTPSLNFGSAGFGRGKPSVENTAVPEEIFTSNRSALSSWSTWDDKRNKLDKKDGPSPAELRLMEEQGSTSTLRAPVVAQQLRGSSEERQRHAIHCDCRLLGSITWSFSAVRFVPGLRWRNPWTYATFGRAYGSAVESRGREVRVGDEADDEDDDDDADEPSECEDEYDVEDEQHIEDSDDNVEEEEVVMEQSAKKKKFTPPKTKLLDQEGRCLNEKIMARFVRLVAEDGKSHRVVSRHEALTLAQAKKMDLVQVDSTSEPPVCKIFDFHKEEYRQTQILKERKKKKGAMAHLGEVKEIRFTAKTELKDLKMKVEKAEGFTDRGYRVKFVAMFKAKADDEKKRLEEEKIIDSVCSMVKNFAIIEQGPRVESRQAWVILRHVKFAKNSSPKRKTQIVESLEHKEQIEQAS